MISYQLLWVGLVASLLSVSAVTTDTSACLSQNFPHVNNLVNSKTTPWSAANTSSLNINVIVYFVAWADTDPNTKFRIPYSAARTPNYFPSGLSNGTYGPQLPDWRVNPIQRASRFFQQMSFGKIGFTATYRSVQLDENMPSACASGCPYSDLANRVYAKVNSSFAEPYKYVYYNVSLLVFPDETYTGSSQCSPHRYFQLGYRTIVYGGYAMFRHNDNILSGNDAYSLFQSLGGLFGLTESDFWDYAKINQIAREDRTDLMGKAGTETRAFTNPYNLYRMGVLDMTNDIRTISRTGIYRVWPLYVQQFDKDYNYDGSLDTTAAQTFQIPQVWQQYRGVLFNPDLSVSGGSVTSSNYYSILWQRNEVTYKIDSEDSSYRAVYNFSHSLILHQHINPSMNTGFTQKDVITNPSNPTDDSITNASRLISGQSLDSFFSVCKSTVLCRDTTTVPVSFLLSVTCMLAKSTVITKFNFGSTQTLNLVISDQSGYQVYFDNSSIINANKSVGYISIAVTGTNCAGAAALKLTPAASTIKYYSPGKSMVFTVYDLSFKWGTSFSSGQSLSVCYAELDSGGVDDEFFVEQTLLSINKKDTLYSPVSSCQDTTLFSCIDADYANTSLVDASSSSETGIYFGCQTSSQLTSCCCYNFPGSTGCGFTAGYYGRKSCCNNRGYVSLYDSYPTGLGSADYGTLCTCDDNSSYTGRYCHDIVGAALKLSVVSNVTFYVGSPFTLSATLGAYPSSSLYNVTCYVIFSNGSNITLGTLTYPKTLAYAVTVSTSLTQQFQVIPNNAFVPWVNFTCYADNPASDFYSNPRHVLQVSIVQKKPVTTPQKLRVTSYGANGTVSFAWDHMDGYQSYSDLFYTLSFRTYQSSSQGSWNYTNSSYDSVSNCSSNSISNVSLIVAQVYEVRITATSPSSGTSATSTSLYVIPIDYVGTCSNFGGDSAPKTCSSSNCNSTYGKCSTSRDCWCKGWYHGADCSISGCYYTASDQAAGISCAGHGTCVSGSDSSLDHCSCNAGYYGMYCRKLDWYNGAITFVNPVDPITTVITQGSQFTVTWNMPDGSLSNGASLYIQYAAPGMSISSYDGWSKIADVSYTTQGASQYSYQVAKVDALGLVPQGSSGIVAFQVRDWYYNNLAQTAYATLQNPNPTLSPTMSPTPSPTKAPTVVQGGTSSGGLTSLSGKNQIFAAVGISVVVLAMSIGTAIFCAGRIRRRMYGTHQLQDVGITGTTDEKATEVATIH